MLQVARDAFVRGMVVVAAVSTAVAIGVAILFLFMLRNVRPGGDSGVTSDTGPVRSAVGSSEPQGAGGV